VFLRRLILLALMTAAAGRPGPAPRYDLWHILGPGGGGTMIGPTISPHDPNLVVEHCDMTGAYITKDGGQSWRMFNLRGVVTTFAFDPRNSSVIDAGNRALWKSEDRGKSWRMVFPNPTKNTVEHMRGDHADYVLTSDDPSYPAGASIEAIAVDPADSKRICLGLSPASGSSLQSARLYTSRDQGGTWEQIGEFPKDRILAIHIPGKAVLAKGEIYLIGITSVHVLTAGRWEHRNGPSGASIQQVSVGRAGEGAPPRVYREGGATQLTGSSSIPRLGG